MGQGPLLFTSEKQLFCCAMVKLLLSNFCSPPHFLKLYRSAVVNERMNEGR